MKKSLSIAVLFLALMLSAQAFAAEFKFAVFADSRSNENNIGVNTAELTKISGLVAAQNPAFVFFPGDLTYLSPSNGGKQNRFMNNWQTTMGTLFIKTYPQMGNHDYLSSVGLTYWQNKFNLPNASTPVINYQAMAGMEDIVYSFQYDNSLFISLSTNYPANDTIGQNQIIWAENTLKNSNASHKFVFLHDPLYPTGCHALPAGRDALMKVLNDNGADVIFAGHEHNYSRVKIDSTRYPQATRTIWQIVSGTSGAPICSTNTISPAAEKFTAAYNYAIITVNGNAVDINAYNDSGVSIDNFNFSPAGCFNDAECTNGAVCNNGKCENICASGSVWSDSAKECIGDGICMPNEEQSNSPDCTTACNNDNYCDSRESQAACPNDCGKCPVFLSYTIDDPPNPQIAGSSIMNEMKQSASSTGAKITFASSGIYWNDIMLDKAKFNNFLDWWLTQVSFEAVNHSYSHNYNYDSRVRINAAKGNCGQDPNYCSSFTGPLTDQNNEINQSIDFFKNLNQQHPEFRLENSLKYFIIPSGGFSSETTRLLKEKGINAVFGADYWLDNAATRMNYNPKYFTPYYSPSKDQAPMAYRFGWLFDSLAMTNQVRENIKNCRPTVISGHPPDFNSLNTSRKLVGSSNIQRVSKYLQKTSPQFQNKFVSDALESFIAFKNTESFNYDSTANSYSATGTNPKLNFLPGLSIKVYKDGNVWNAFSTEYPNQQIYGSGTFIIKFEDNSAIQRISSISRPDGISLQSASFDNSSKALTAGFPSTAVQTIKFFYNALASFNVYDSASASPTQPVITISNKTITSQNSGYNATYDKNILTITLQASSQARSIRLAANPPPACYSNLECGTTACPAASCSGNKTITYPSTCQNTCNITAGTCTACVCTQNPQVDCSLTEKTCQNGTCIAMPANCGNGVINSGEQCDDGNLRNGDGCSSTCQIEQGWTCSGTPSTCAIIPVQPYTGIQQIRISDFWLSANVLDSATTINYKIFVENKGLAINASAKIELYDPASKSIKYAYNFPTISITHSVPNSQNPAFGSLIAGSWNEFKNLPSGNYKIKASLTAQNGNTDSFERNLTVLHSENSSNIPELPLPLLALVLAGVLSVLYVKNRRSGF